MPDVAGRLRPLATDGILADVATIAGAVTTTQLNAIDSRVTAVEETGGGGSAAPNLFFGPRASGVLATATRVCLISVAAIAAIGLAAGTGATLALRVKGQGASGVGIVRDVVIDALNAAGVLSVTGYAAGVAIDSGRTAAVNGWAVTVRVVDDGSALEVLVVCPEAANWSVSLWLSSDAGLAEAAPEIEISAAASATSTTVPVRVVSSSSVTAWQISEDVDIPATPTWLTASPVGLDVGGAGARSIYCTGRTDASVLTTRKRVTVNVVLDSILPTITAFSLPGTATTLTVDVTALTASETCTYHYQIDNATLTSPVWGAAPTTITFATYGEHTVSIWCRDAAGNVCEVPASATITLNEQATYLDDTFDATDTWLDFNTPVHTVTGGNLQRTDVAAFRGVYHAGTTAIPAESGCMTWNFMSAELAGGFLFFAANYVHNAGTPTGVQIGWGNATPTTAAPGIWSGPLNFEAPNGTWSGAQQFPATWTTAGIEHQLSLSWVTTGGTTTYTLTLDGLAYGTFVGATMVAGTAVAWLGTTDMVGGVRLMGRCRVTSYIPEYV